MGIDFTKTVEIIKKFYNLMEKKKEHRLQNYRTIDYYIYDELI